MDKQREKRIPKIRNYAKSVSFDVVGKLRYMGKYDRNTRWFLDDGQNAFLIDEVIGTIRIIPKKKKPADYSAGVAMVVICLTLSESDL